MRNTVKRPDEADIGVIIVTRPLNKDRKIPILLISKTYWNTDTSVLFFSSVSASFYLPLKIF